MGITNRMDREWIRRQLDQAKENGYYIPPKDNHALLSYIAYILENHDEGIRNLEDEFLPLVTEDIKEYEPSSSQDNNSEPKMKKE